MVNRTILLLTVLPVVLALTRHTPSMSVAGKRKVRA